MLYVLHIDGFGGSLRGLSDPFRFPLLRMLRGVLLRTGAPEGGLEEEGTQEKVLKTVQHQREQ